MTPVELDTHQLLYPVLSTLLIFSGMAPVELDAHQLLYLVPCLQGKKWLLGGKGVKSHYGSKVRIICQREITNTVTGMLLFLLHPD